MGWAVRENTRTQLHCVLYNSLLKCKNKLLGARNYFYNIIACYFYNVSKYIVLMYLRCTLFTLRRQNALHKVKCKGAKKVLSRSQIWLRSHRSGQPCYTLNDYALHLTAYSVLRIDFAIICQWLFSRLFPPSLRYITVNAVHRWQAQSLTY